ncbi:MAG: hypothetical protein FJ290_31615 [Planctomycetes bacterium]|nr:hypothetical protein [Planctomycetota bacterium]
MTECFGAGAVSRIEPLDLAGLLFVAAVLAAGTVRGAEEPAGPPKSVRWGPKDESGLQLGAWLDPQRPILRCAIRNEGGRAVSYSDYLLGYWESVTIRARRDAKDEWQAMPLRHRDMRGVYSAGAIGNNVHLIVPGEQMLPKHEERERQAALAKRPPWTFSVNLWEYEWPRSWTGTVEVMVRQKLGEDGSRDTWAGTLESGVVEVPLGDLASDPVVGAIKAFLPDGWVGQKVEDNAYPFYFENGSGKEIWLGPPLETIDLARVKVPAKAMLWIMPSDYQGRRVPGVGEAQTGPPRLIHSTKTERLYWWGELPAEVRNAVLNALYWAAVPAKR